jgi:hypothetical protein
MVSDMTRKYQITCVTGHVLSSLKKLSKLNQYSHLRRFYHVGKFVRITAKKSSFLPMEAKLWRHPLQPDASTCLNGGRLSFPDHWIRIIERGVAADSGNGMEAGFETDWKPNPGA